MRTRASDALAMPFQGAFCLLLACFPCTSAYSQIMFSANDVQNVVGQYCLCYYNTNVDVPSLLGNSGGPQTWDFSQPTNQLVLRWDVVDANDAQNVSGLTNPAYAPYWADFSSATFAERFKETWATNEVWRFDSLSPNVGLFYYGTFTLATSSNSTGYVWLPFNTRANYLPDPVHFGQAWSWSVYLTNITFANGTLFMSPALMTLTANDTVDAWGTVVLPGLGAAPALRVTEAFNQTNNTFGFITVSSFTNYLWLVRGIGPAVQLNIGQTSGVNNELIRVFAASPRSVAGLRAQRVGGSLRLDWNIATNRSGYQVQGLTELRLTNWTTLATLTTNSWTTPFNPAQPPEFFRVLLLP